MLIRSHHQNRLSCHLPGNFPSLDQGAAVRGVQKRKQGLILLRLGCRNGQATAWGCFTGIGSGALCRNRQERSK
jgi:hypothetical protein